MLKLLCIKTGCIVITDNRTGEKHDMMGTHLQLGAEYTSPGIALDEHGAMCYIINEIDNGDLKLAQRFRDLTERNDNGEREKNQAAIKKSRKN